MPQRHLSSLTFSLIALLVFVLSPPLARADGGDTSHHASVVGYTADLVFPEGSLKTGPNTVLLRLSNAEGQPASAATVQIAPVALSGADSGEHGHGEASSDSGAATGGHDDAGAASHNDADTAIHTEATSESHGDTHQLEAAAEEHRHSEGTSAQHTAQPEAAAEHGHSEDASAPPRTIKMTSTSTPL
jgi:hypothetical protein